MKNITVYLRTKKQEMLSLLERLVNIDCGSNYKKGVAECGSIVAEHLKAMGFDIEMIPESDCGNHYVCRRAGHGKDRLLILAHLDTVWPEGTAAKRPFSLKGGSAYGPGVGAFKLNTQGRSAHVLDLTLFRVRKPAAPMGASRPQWESPRWTEWGP